MAWPPDQIDRVSDIVRIDLTTNLSPFFEPTEITFDTAIADPDEPLRNAKSAALAWTYHGRHIAEFQGIQPTAAALVVKINGMTILHRAHDGAGPPAIRRYIDWHHVLAQLGAVPGRAIQPQPEPPAEQQPE